MNKLIYGQQNTKKPTTVLFAVAALMLSLCWATIVHAEQADNAAIAQVETVKIKARTDHQFSLVADYYLGADKSGGVIVLHDCKSDRRRYKNLANRLAEQGLHTLLVDFRGYGESVAEGFSREQIKKNSLNIVSYQSEMALLTTYWQEDLQAAYEFLRIKIAENKGISIVASGCSSAYAVALAEKILLNSIVFITPKMTYSDKERYKNLIDIPSYFVSSSHHQDSYQTAQELFTWSGAKQSKMQIFKGDSYSYQLINRKKHLTEDIAHWIKPTLEN